MKTVLIVDADPIERNLVARYLTEAGYNVVESANSNEAVRVADLFEDEIHLAVIGNPKLIGAAKEIAAIRSSIAILVMYRANEDQVLLGSLPAAVDSAFLQKPFLPVLLLDKVRGLLNRT